MGEVQQHKTISTRNQVCYAIIEVPPVGLKQPLVSS